MYIPKNKEITALNKKKNFFFFVSALSRYPFNTSRSSPKDANQKRNAPLMWSLSHREAKHNVRLAGKPCDVKCTNIEKKKNSKKKIYFFLKI